MLIFNPLKYDFWFSYISVTMKAITNLGESCKKEFVKGILWKTQNTNQT